jgi:hypothetical protein
MLETVLTRRSSFIRRGCFQDDDLKRPSKTWTVQGRKPHRRKSASATASPGSGTILVRPPDVDFFEGFWRQFDDDGSAPAPDPHAPGSSPEQRAIATFINDATKVVFSKTRDQLTWRNSPPAPRVRPARDRGHEARTGPGHSGLRQGSIVSQLTEHRLIDEYQFVVNPTLIGHGRPLLGNLSKSVRLHLLEAREYPTGNVMLRYERRG